MRNEINVQCKTKRFRHERRICWQRKRRDTPRPVSSGTCERFRGAVLSSVGTWSSVTYRALVANAVITKQSCSRTTKKEIYKDTRAHKKKKKNDGQGFPHLRSGSSVFGGMRIDVSEAMFCQGTALFDVMTVLACLSSTINRNYLHLHAPAQPIILPKKRRCRLFKREGGWMKLKKKKKEQTVEWTSASDLIRCFN